MKALTNIIQVGQVTCTGGVPLTDVGQDIIEK